MSKTLIGIAVVLTWYSVVGHRRVIDWTSELSLWTRATVVQPDNPRAHINRAKAFYGVGLEDDAIREVTIADAIERGRERP